MKNNLTIKDIDRIIEMAWEDRTPFEAIEFQFGLPESEVIKLMRTQKKLLQPLAKKSKFWHQSKTSNEKKSRDRKV